MGPGKTGRKVALRKASWKVAFRNLSPDHFLIKAIHNNRGAGMPCTLSVGTKVASTTTAKPPEPLYH